MLGRAQYAEKGAGHIGSLLGSSAPLRRSGVTGSPGQGVPGIRQGFRAGRAAGGPRSEGICRRAKGRYRLVSCDGTALLRRSAGPLAFGGTHRS